MDFHLCLSIYAIRAACWQWSGFALSGQYKAQFALLGLSLEFASKLTHKRFLSLILSRAGRFARTRGLNDQSRERAEIEQPMELVIPHRFRYMAVEVFAFTNVASTYLTADLCTTKEGEQFAPCSSWDLWYIMRPPANHVYLFSAQFFFPFCPMIYNWKRPVWSNILHGSPYLYLRKFLKDTFCFLNVVFPPSRSFFEYKSPTSRREW